MLRDRTPVIAPLALACILTSLALAAAPTRAAPPTITVEYMLPERSPIELGIPETVAENTDVMSSAGVVASAHALYCHKRFAEAATVIATAVADDPQLAPLADLYRELAETYGAAQPGNTLEARFEALVIARRDDLVLGGMFAAELTTALADLAPKAAITFMAANDYEHAQLALAIGESLGIDDANIRAVRKALDHRRLELK